MPEEERQKLVNELMGARSAARSKVAMRGPKMRRARVSAAKIGLGERGPKWWENSASNEVETAKDESETAKDEEK